MLSNGSNMAKTAAIALATLALHASCASSGDGPRPSELVPNTAARGVSTLVRIVGRGFAPLVHASYDEEGRSRISADFSAQLGQRALTQVRFVSSTELSASVPGDLALGIHDLTVVDPMGAGGVLAGAFTVLAGADGGPADGGADGPPKDGPGLDGPGAHDGQPPTDTKPPADHAVKPDAPVKPDQGVTGSSAAQISAALQKVTVQCIDRSGKPKGGTIPILDTTTTTLVAGTVTLSGAPTQTKAWVGGKTSVCVVWDLNACDLEDPMANDGDWTSAGLLIRGATLSGGQLMLPTGIKTTDIDFINVDPAGQHTGNTDFAGPDDSDLTTSYPQLVNPISAAKQVVVGL